MDLSTRTKDKELMLLTSHNLDLDEHKLICDGEVNKSEIKKTPVEHLKELLIR